MAGIFDFLNEGFTPMNAQGAQPQLGFMEALGQNRNALTGLGLGLLGGTVGNPNEHILQGYQKGANADIINQYRQQQLRQAAQERAYQHGQDKQAQSNWERTFKQRADLSRGATTNDIMEYRYSQTPEGGNYKGTFPEWMARKKEGAGLENVEAKAAATATGKARGEASVALPGTEAAATQILGLIDEVRKEKGLGRDLSHGSIGGRMGPIGGAQAAYIGKVDQLKGRAFLEAYSILKGGGQISEIEGKKAEQAIARLSRVQDIGDFNRALDDLEGVVKSSVTTARQKAGVSGASQPPSKQPDPWGIR